jgi:hypothetical protein
MHVWSAQASSNTYRCRPPAIWVLSTIALCWPTHASAQASTVRAQRESRVLSWDAQPSCVSPADAQRQIEQHLGRSLRTLPTGLHARVTLRPLVLDELEARITLRLGPRSYERQLRDTRCESLAGAAAIVVALTIDVAIQDSKSSSATTPSSPMGTLEGSSPSDTRLVIPEVEQTALPPAAPPPPQRTVDAADPMTPALTPRATTGAAPRDLTWPPRLPRTQATHRRRQGVLSGFGGIAAGISSGTLPGISYPVSLFVGLLRGPLQLALRVSYLSPQWDRPAGVVAARGSVALSTGALEVGVRLRRGSFELPVLIGLEAGRFFATSEGTVDQRRAHAPWLAAQLAAELRYLLREHIALLLRVAGGVALQRPRFALRASDLSLLEYHRPDALLAQLAAGVEVRFP